MRRTSALITLGFVFGLAVRCGAQAAGQDKAIEAVRTEWVQDLEGHKLERSLALYTDEAAFLSSDGSAIYGKDALRALYQQVFAAYTGVIVLNRKQMVNTENMACESGVYGETLTSVKTGEKRQVKGSYSMVYLRDRSGAWHIAQQAWTEGPSAQ